MVHDGSDYLNYASMKNVLDNLIHRLEIPDCIVAFTDSPDRLREYANDAAHAKFLTEELVPDLERRLPLIGRPHARALMGASFGGVAALSTAFRYPGFWGRLLLQSGSFGADATARVERLLAAYAFALLGNASGRVLTTTSYAIGDTRTPARYAVYRVVASTAFALILMQWLDALGVVLGAVIAAWVETIALGWKLRTQIGGLGLEKVPVTRALLLGAISIAPALAAKHGMPEEIVTSLVGSIGVLAVFGAAFALAAPALGIFDLRSLLRRRR